MDEFAKRRAKAHYVAYRYSECLAVCDAALADDPTDADAHGERGSALVMLGDDRGAAAAWGRAIELDCQAKYLYWRAGVWLDLDEFDRAIDDARRLIAIGEAEEDHYFRDGAFMILAVAHFYARNLEQCRRACAEVSRDSVWWCKGRLHTVPMLLGEAG